MSAKIEMDRPSNWSNKGVLEQIFQSDTTCYSKCKCNACFPLILVENSDEKADRDLAAKESIIRQRWTEPGYEIIR